MAGLDKSNPFVGIAAVLGGMLVGIVALAGIFAPTNFWVVAPVAGAIAVMGIALGYFASKKK